MMFVWRFRVNKCAKQRWPPQSPRLTAAILDFSHKETPDHKIVAKNGFLDLKSVTTHVFCKVARYFDENII